MVWFSVYCSVIPTKFVVPVCDVSPYGGLSPTLAPCSAAHPWAPASSLGTLATRTTHVASTGFQGPRPEPVPGAPTAPPQQAAYLSYPTAQSRLLCSWQRSGVPTKSHPELFQEEWAGGLGRWALPLPSSCRLGSMLPPQQEALPASACPSFSSSLGNSPVAPWAQAKVTPPTPCMCHLGFPEYLCLVQITPASQAENSAGSPGCQPSTPRDLGPSSHLGPGLWEGAGP